MSAIKRGLLLLFMVTAAQADSLPSYQITIADGVFTPSKLEVEAGARIKIIIKNVGKGPAEFENLTLKVEKVLSAEVSSFVVIPPLKPGSYHFIDEFHPDGAGLEMIAR